MIPYGKHHIDEEDIEAVVEVLRNGALTQGPKVNEFEESITAYTGAKYAVAVSSGTAALHLACMVANVGAGDKVITTPNTFVASANCILYVGGEPVFVDINADTLNIDTNKLQTKCENSESVKAIIPVHFAGLPCEMDKIRKISLSHHAVVIEDASHALGATYKDGSRVGNCRYSDMTVFSFHPVKGIASGEGGMITTNDEDLYNRLLHLRSHGICKGNFEFPGISYLDNKLSKPDKGVEDGELKMWYYEMQELGYNYRITDIQSALAISQMKKIDRYVKRRQELVGVYDSAFEQHDLVESVQVGTRINSSHHIYVLRINFEKAGITRHQLMKMLKSENVGSQVHYIPVPMHPYYEELGYNMADYPNTFEYYKSALSIPLYYELSNDEQSIVIEILNKFLK